MKWFDANGLVKIIAYYYYVSITTAVHWFIVIIDNQVGSPTYGQKWYISGYPTIDGNYSSGIGSDQTLTTEVQHESKRHYDSEREAKGGVILVDDQSDVGPWVDRAKRRSAKRNGSSYYRLTEHNSNTFFYDILEALGLLDVFDSAIEKRYKEGKDPLVAPGYHPWLRKPRGFWGPEKIGS